MYRNYSRRANHLIYINGVKESQYCAQSPDRNDVCNGDSGGPLQFFSNNSRTAHVVGIISVGSGCGTLPTLHTRVASYVEWITDRVWPNGFENLNRK